MSERGLPDPKIVPFTSLFIIARSNSDIVTWFSIMLAIAVTTTVPPFDVAASASPTMLAVSAGSA